MIINHHPWLLKTKISLCSNGLLYYEPKVQQFLNKFRGFVSLGFSIDGNKELHDMCRKDIYGNGTYDRAISAILDYHKKSGATLTTKMTLSPENISFASPAIIDLIEKGFTEIYVNCIYEEGWTYEHGTILYNELKKIADYVIEHDLYNKVYIRIFDRKLYQPESPLETNNWCGGTSDMNIAVDYKG